MIISHACQHIGSREQQEDAFRISDAGTEIVAVLCDGMGGHAGGKDASMLAVDAFVRAFAPGSNQSVYARLEHGVERANDAIAKAADQSPVLAEMGTTLVGVSVADNVARWISVGDSILWLLRSDVLTRLNEDHSVGGILDEQARRGEISVEEATNRHDRHALTSVLQGREIACIDLPEEPLVLQEGDILVLATDGVLTLADTEIRDRLAAAVARGEDPAAALCERVISAGSQYQDNISVVALRRT